MTIQIRDMTDSDWQEVKSIYEFGISTGYATFETEAPEWEEWDDSHLKDCRIVAESEGNVVGWAALSPVSNRCVYGGVAEISVYVSPDHHGEGIGKKLLKQLIDLSEKHGIWTLDARIFPDNQGSISIHKSCGFNVVGRRKKLGQINGIWKDVLLLERRSEKVGI